MRRAALAVAAFAALAAAAIVPLATAEQNRSQQFFRDQLLADESVSPAVKELLRSGGFVDARIKFAELTGDGKDDALVRVQSGGAMGAVAVYVFSTDTRGGSSELVPVFRSEKLVRASSRVSSGRASYSYARYKAGDELCCPSEVGVATLGWDAKRKRFTVVERERRPGPAAAGG